MFNIYHCNVLLKLGRPKNNVEQVAGPSTSQFVESAVEKSAESAIQTFSEPATTQFVELAVEKSAESAIQTFLELAVEESAIPAVEQSIQTEENEAAVRAVENVVINIIPHSKVPPITISLKHKVKKLKLSIYLNQIFILATCH